MVAAEDETSLNDMHEVKGDPFKLTDRLKQWILRDSFRSIKLSVIVASVVLTIALIFDTNFGIGPIASHGAIACSNTICSEFGESHLKESRNSFDAAIVTALCLLATNREQVSLGGGGVAAVHFVNSTKASQYIDFTGRKNQTTAIPGFMAGLIKLKDMANVKVKENPYTHSNTAMVNLELGQLILKAKDFIDQKILEKNEQFKDGPDGQSNMDLIKALLVLSRNPRSFYDKGNGELEKGDLWAVMSNNGDDESFSDLLDFDKQLAVETAEYINVTNGKIEVHPDSKRLLIALGVIDRRDMDRNDASFALLVANSLFETGKLKDSEVEDVENAAEKIDKKIKNNEDHVMQGDPWTHSPWVPEAYKSAFVTVVGDDAQIISITLTVGRNPYGDCRRINQLKYCFANYEGLSEQIFPAPILIRPTCGVCGRYTAMAGDPVSLVNFAGQVIKHSGLFYGEFSERVMIDQVGTIIVEAGLPAQYPEMNEKLKTHSVKLTTAAPGQGIGFVSAVEWANDAIHAISDKRIDKSWPARVF